MLEVGRIDRPHGVRGEVAVSLVTNREERLAPGSRLASDRGPLVVSSSRPHKGRHLVVFEGVSSREAADALRGVVLRAGAIEDPGELWVHELIGSSVFDQHGSDRGRVVGVVENPASDLLELEDGALVPVRFVVSAPPGAPIEVDVPAGLFDDEDEADAAEAADEDLS